MIWYGKDINKDYAWEISALHKIRDFKDGISFIDFDINWDRYLADHTPAFNFSLEILNYKIFEFNIYYQRHRDLEN